MNIYRSKGEPKKIKTTKNPLEYENWDKDWEHLGDAPSRVSVLRNATDVDLTEKEMKDHLYLTEKLLENIIEDIRKIRSKL